MIYSCTFIVFLSTFIHSLSKTSFSFHGILLITESQIQVVVYCTALLMQLIIHAKLLLLLKFYLLKIMSLFYGFFFFFGNRKYPFLYTLLFCIHYLYRGIFKNVEMLFRSGFSQALNYLNQEYNHFKYNLRT